MEKVYGNTSKVMIDVEGSNNMMYLPLDKIIQQQNTSKRSNKTSYAPLTEPNINTSPSSSSDRSDRFSNGRN